MILTEKNIKELMKSPRNSNALVTGETLQSEHKVHITGDGYLKLVRQVEGFEGGEEFNIRKQISKPVTIQITSTILDNLNRWTSAQGTVKKVDFKDKEKNQAFQDVLNQVWQGDSMEKFINTFYRDAIYTEFNGFILVTKPKEIEGGYIEREGVIYPKESDTFNPYLIFIANSDVYDYYLTGDKCEYLIIKIGEESYRLIDDEKDLIFKWDKQKESVITESEITNEMGYVPARKISGINNSLLTSQVKTSPIKKIIPALDRYFSADADLRMQFIRHNYPKLAIVSKECHACDGEGYQIADDDSKITCRICNGTGKVIPISRGGVIALPQYIDSQESAYPGSPASYITPDTQSLQLGLDDLKDQEQKIVYSGTGDKNLIAESLNTATENVINSRSLEDRISDITAMIEDFETFVIQAVKDMHNDFKNIEDYNITIRYGKRISTKSEEELLSEIELSKKSGMPTSYIASLQKDLVYAKYKNNSVELERQLLLGEVEPLTGYTISEVKNMAEYVNDRDLTVKVNFDSIIAEIEQDEPLNYFMNGQDYSKKVEALNKKIDEVLQRRREGQANE